jgi:hypothetical protein
MAGEKDAMASLSTQNYFIRPIKAFPVSLPQNIETQPRSSCQRFYMMREKRNRPGTVRFQTQSA